MREQYIIKTKTTEPTSTKKDVIVSTAKVMTIGIGLTVLTKVIKTTVKQASILAIKIF